ncbi:hypothetical protein ACSBM8_12370 [Sphingomonas sp. ASY06-1R]|uniref:hypothetical protein n=1 Tax=Sphingomonas sp. ASY06-1R TaxID=3445771 RepID=UPI003FA2FBE7
MSELPQDLEEAIAKFDDLARQLEQAIAQCEAEQRRGGIGYNLYNRAKIMEEQTRTFAAALTKRIDDEIGKL